MGTFNRMCVSVSFVTGLLTAATAETYRLTSDATWADFSAISAYDGVEIAENVTLTLNPASGTLVANKPISGAGNLVKDGAGALELRAANTFDGTFLIGGTGSVYAYDNAAFGSTAGGTTLNESLGGSDGTSDGAYLYLCGITTYEPIEVINNNKKGRMIAAENTVNHLYGAVTFTGNQATAHAYASSELHFHGGGGVGTQIRLSTETGSHIYIEDNPFTGAFFNAQTGKGLIHADVAGICGGYTWVPIRCGVDWAFNGADFNFRMTANNGPKIDLYGHPQRITRLDSKDNAKNTYITDTSSGAGADLHVEGTTGGNSYVPFQSKAGLRYGVNTTTTTYATHTSSGNLAVTNGTLAFAETASWSKVGDVTVAEKGHLTLARADQLGNPNKLTLTGEGVLTVPDDTVLTVCFLELDGVPKGAGTYAVDQLNGHLVGTGAKVVVMADAGYLVVSENATWAESEIATKIGSHPGVVIKPGVTQTLDVVTAYSPTVPYVGQGVLSKTGAGDLELRQPNVIGCTLDVQAGNLQVYEGVAVLPSALVNVYGTNGAQAHFHAVNATGRYWFYGDSNNSLNPLQVTGEGKTVFLGAVRFPTQSEPVVATGGQLDFAGGLNAYFRCNTLPSGSVITIRDTPAKLTGLWTGTYKGRIDLSVASNVFDKSALYVCSWSDPAIRTTVPWAIYDACIDVKKNVNGALHLDICGCDQGCCRLDSSVIVSPIKWRTEGYVTSAGAAQLHVMGDSTAADKNDLNFRGSAGLSLEAAKTLTLYGCSTGNGRLDVKKGEVVFGTTSGTDPKPEYGDWVRYGTWSNASCVAVCDGAKLTIAHDKGVFGKTTEFSVDGADTRIALADGTVQTVGALYLDGAPGWRRGTYGGPDSPAEFKDARFTGTGVLKTTQGKPRGLAVVIR